MAIVNTHRLNGHFPRDPGLATCPVIFLHLLCNLLASSNKPTHPSDCAAHNLNLKLHFHLPRLATKCQTTYDYQNYLFSNKTSEVAEMGDRLATTDVGRKVAGDAVTLSVGELGLHLTQCHLSIGLPQYQVVS